MSIYNIPIRSIDGEENALLPYEGKVTLMVNVSSKAGYDPKCSRFWSYARTCRQFWQLQKVHDEFKDRGFSVLAFPCNQFGQQEPGDEPAIADFCVGHYATQFPLFAKTDVNGEQAHPLFRYLCHTRPGVLGTTAIKWNLTKFLLDRHGRVIERYAPMSKPETLAAKIESLL